MENYWIQQTASKPKYPDMLWSRPENKSYAGKLLIIGGNSFGFAAPVNTYIESQKAGVGFVRVLLPESTKKLVGHASNDVSYCVSNLSGAFGSHALADFLDNADWSDGTLFAGEMGNNSETVILIEKFITKYSGLVVLTNDAVDLSLNFYASLLARNETIIVTDIARLQKLQVKSRELHPVTSNISLVNLVNNLHEFTINHKLAVTLEYSGYALIAYEGLVGSTKVENSQSQQLNKLASHVAVWSIQNPSKIFESLSCALITFQK